MKLQLLHSKVLFFCLLYLVTCGHLNAKDAPEWVLEKPKNDSVYKYYIGRASDHSSANQAITEACNDARRQAIVENYGVKAKVETQTYATNDKIELTERASETSEEVTIQGLELEQSWPEKTKKGNYDGWALYKYPVFEIEKEKKRLASLIGKKEVINFQDAGSSEVGVASQPFEIVTSPAGAKVYLDGELLIVRTPLKIDVANGEHSIQIDHTNYKTVSEKVIALESKTKRLEYRLVPAPGFISIDSEPSNAMVLVDGQPVGQDPIRKLPIQAGKNVLIQIKHPEAEIYSQTIKLEKDETRNINQRLSLKPAKLNIMTEPLGVAISINGTAKGVTPLKRLTLEPGEYTINFSKNGYKSENKDIKLRGDEYRTLETTSLSKEESEESTPIYTHQKRTEYIRQLDLTLGIGYTFISASSSNQYFNKNNNGLNIMLGGERGLTSVIGMKFYTLFALNGTKKALEIYAGLPIYIHSFYSNLNSYLALSPLLGFQPYNNTKLDTGYGAKIYQYFYGIEAEYRYYWPIGNKSKLGLGCLMGYKNYSQTGSSIYMAITTSLRF